VKSQFIHVLLFPRHSDEIHLQLSCLAVCQQRSECSCAVWHGRSWILFSDVVI